MKHSTEEGVKCNFIQILDFLLKKINRYKNKNGLFQMRVPFIEKYYENTFIYLN